MIPGTLYIVATPIGNLEDITLRALRVLKEVAVVAAEDTRHSRKLLTHYGIATPLTPYHEHNEEEKSGWLLARLQGGESVALITDAGTPAISDPGFVLVRHCREVGVPVMTVPGPAAVTAALAVSGLPNHRFAFEGFLPAKKKAREDLLAELADEERTLVFYEAPHRLVASLEAIVRLLGAPRQVAVARELTKLHEDFFRGSARDALEKFGAQPVKGEIVLLVAPAEKKGSEAGSDPVAALRRLAQAEDLAPAELVKRVTRETGAPRREVYRIYLELKEEGGLG